ncbi:hypothetical protein HY029_06080 [Candidatus Gottesmanbacteria bacterium]|nr:hypothetical protein [Candidatus Gottesmanbacteria bacterium]
MDIFDYNLVITNFGKTHTPRTLSRDANGVAKVDIFDYNQVVTYFGT